MIRPPFLIPEIIFLIISIPLVLGWVPRNRFYGVRTRKTISDDRIWYAANRFGGLLFMICSFLYLCIAAFVPYSSDSATLNWWVHIAGFILPLFMSFLAIHFYTRRL